MIDIGANLANSQFDNKIENILLNAVKNNVKTIVLTTTDLKYFNKNLDLIKKYNHIIDLKTTFGLHPHNAKDNLLFFKEYDSLINNENVVAIGEFGLDYNRMFSTKEEQVFTMKQFLEKTKNSNLPLFLHERDAFEDFYNLIKNNNSKKVIHSFTGNKNQAIKYLDIDCFFSINGWITDSKRNNDLLEAIKYIPLSKLMIETDCPYLSPKNLPKKIFLNEPQYLKYIVDYLVNIYKISAQEIIEITTQNSINFFNLKINHNLIKKL